LTYFGKNAAVFSDAPSRRFAVGRGSGSRRDTR
jgi:hypothetical protein